MGSRDHLINSVIKPNSFALPPMKKSLVLNSTLTQLQNWSLKKETKEGKLGGGGVARCCSASFSSSRGPALLQWPGWVFLGEGMMKALQLSSRCLGTAESAGRLGTAWTQLAQPLQAHALAVVLANSAWCRLAAATRTCKQTEQQIGKTKCMWPHLRWHAGKSDDRL